MPIYSYKNKTTGEETDVNMTITEMEEFEAQHTDLERVYKPIAMVDPAGIGLQKPPSDFQKYVLGRIKEKNPGSDAIASKRWSIPKEI